MADIYVTRGDARDLDILIEDPDHVAINVVDWEAEFALCANILGQEPLIHWTSAANPTKFDIGIADPEHVVIHLDDEDTADLAPGWYAWDLKLTDLGGADFHPIAGYLHVADAQV